MKDTIRFEVQMPVDEEGMFGRMCPNDECGKYFKADVSEFKKWPKEYLYCPYCGVYQEAGEFLTKEQREYLQSIAMKKVLDELTPTLKSMEIKPDPRAFISLGIKVKIPNIQIRKYVESEIEKKIVCEKCKTRCAVYGNSYFCMYCGQRDALNVYQENMDFIHRFLNFETLVKNVPGVSNTELTKVLKEVGMIEKLKEKSLDMIVTAFETFCKTNYIEKMKQLDPSIDSNAEQKRIGNSFQNIFKGDKLMKSNLKFDMLNGLSKDEIELLNLKFNKRHVLIHNSGIIDDRYLQNTNQDEKLLSRRVTLNKRKLEAMISLLEKIVVKINESI